MPDKRPKCKLCDAQHRFSQPHSGYSQVVQGLKQPTTVTTTTAGEPLFIFIQSQNNQTEESYKAKYRKHPGRGGKRNGAGRPSTNG